MRSRAHARLVAPSVLVLVLSGCGLSPGGSGGVSAGPTIAGSSASPSAKPTATPAPFGVVDEVEVGPSPWGIIYAFESVWTPGRDAVYRIDSTSNTVIATIPLPEGLAGGVTFREGASGPALHTIAASDDAVWVAHSAQQLTLVRIDPESETITDTVELGEDAEIPSITAAFGSLWVANFADSTVSRVDAQTLEITEVIETDAGQGGGPSGIGAAAGSIWVANHRGNEVIRIDPGSNTVAARIELDISVGRLSAADDGVWVVSAGETGIVRIDPTSGEVFAALGPCSSIQSVAAGSAFVWVTSDSGLCRVDKSSMEVENVRINLNMWGVADGGGAVWVTSQQDGIVARIEPL